MAATVRNGFSQILVPEIAVSQPGVHVHARSPDRWMWACGY